MSAKSHLGAIARKNRAKSGSKSAKSDSRSPSRSRPGTASGSEQAPKSTKKSTKLNLLEKEPRKMTARSLTMQKKGLKILDLSGQGMTSLLANHMSSKEIGELDLSSNNLRSLPPEIQQMKTLVVLNISKNGIKCTNHKDFQGLPQELASLPNLEVLHIAECNLPFVPPAIWTLKNLKELDISRNKINVLYPEIGNLMKLQVLNAQQTNIHTLPPEIAFCQELEELMLWGNVIESLPETLKEMPKLRRVCINYRSFGSMIDSYMENLLKKGQIQSEHIPPVLFEMPNMEVLDLGETKINNLPEKCYANLKEFYLSKNFFQKVPKMIFEIKMLSSLDLSNNIITDIPADFQHLSNLLYLKMDGNKIRNIPTELGNLKKLEGLSLGHNQIEYLPSSIGKLRKLKTMILCNNKISALPNSVIELEQLETLDLTSNIVKTLPLCFYQMKKLKSAHTYHKFRKYGLWLHLNPLESPPPEIWRSDNPDKIYRYLKKQQIIQTENLQRQKLIVLGESQSGKTSLIHTMMTGKSNMMKDSSKSTEIIDYIIWLTENQVDFMVHDCGGAEIYKLLQPMFFDPRALYLIVYDHRKYNPQNHYSAIGYWLDTLHLHAPGAIVKIAGTHIDLMSTDFKEKTLEQVREQVKLQMQDQTERVKQQIKKVDQGIEEQDPKYVMTNLKSQKSKLSMLLANPLRIDDDIQLVSSNHGIPGIVELEYELEILAVNKEFFPHAQRYIPENWVKFRGALKKCPDNYLSWDQVGNIAKNFNIVNEGFKSCVEFLNSVGDILWFPHREALQNLIFHRPRHLVDILNGLFRHNLDQLLDFERNKVFFSRGHFTKDSFEEAAENFKKHGQISRPFLKCLWFYQKLGPDNFENIQELLPKFDFCYLIPQLDIPLKKSEFQPLMVIPWYNKDDNEGSISDIWPEKPKKDEVELQIDFVFPIQYPMGLFELLASRIQDHVISRIDWQNCIYAEWASGNMILRRGLDTETYDCVVSTIIRGKNFQEVKDFMGLMWDHLQDIFLHCRGLITYIKTNAVNVDKKKFEDCFPKELFVKT